MAAATQKGTRVLACHMKNDSHFNAGLGCDNELFDYLSTKSETATKCHIRNRRMVPFPFRSAGGGRPRVLLILPPITIPKGMAKRCIPPLGITYIAASLREAGFPVRILDASVEGYETERTSEDGSLLTYGLSLERIRERIADENPDIVGISLIFSTDLDNVMDVCQLIKKHNPEIPVVVGGLHPTIYPREILQESVRNGHRSIDFIIRGEGERRFLGFLEDSRQGHFDLNAEGLCGWYKERIFTNAQLGRIQNLDALPFPAYDLLPIEKYFDINVPFSPVPKGRRVLPILTSRGCPVGCRFCASTNVYHTFIARTAQNVIEEIVTWQADYDIDEIQFADDNLTLDRRRSLELFEKLADLNINWCTPNGIMINTINDELIEAMHRSGLYQITLSFDSGNAKSLKAFHNKPVNLTRVPDLARKAKDLGIFSHGTLVVGMPGETVEDIQESFDFAYDLELTSLSVFIAAAIPGSALYHTALNNGLIAKEDARTINTTKAKMSLADIPAETLEHMIVAFQKKYAEKVRRSNPDLLQRKYGAFVKRNPHASEMIDFRLT